MRYHITCLIYTALLPAFFGGTVRKIYAEGLDDRPPTPFAIPNRAPQIELSFPAEEVRLKDAPLVVAVKPESQPHAGPERLEPVKEPTWRKIGPEYLFSDNSMLYVTLQHFPRSMKAFERSVFASLLTEEEVLYPLMSTLDRLRESYVKGDGARLEFEIERRQHELELFAQFPTFFEDQVALSIEPFERLEGSSTSTPRYIFALAMPSGPRGLEIKQAISALMERYSAKIRLDPRYEDFAEPVGSYDVLGHRCADLGLDESWAFVENLFLYGQGRDIVIGAIQNFHERQSRGTLGLNANFEAGRSNVGENVHLFAQVQIEKLLTAIPGFDLRLGMLQRALLPNLSHLEQIALGLRVKEGEKAPISEKLLLRTKEGQTKEIPGVVKAISAYLASNDTIFYHTHQGSLSEFLKPIVDVGSEKMQGPNPLANLQSELMRGCGVNSIEEVWNTLSPFKGEMTLMLSRVPGRSPRRAFLEVFPYVIALEINRADVAAVSGILEKFAKASRKDFKRLNYQRQNYVNQAEIHYQVGALHGENKDINPLLSKLVPWVSGDKDANSTPFFTAYTIVDVTPPDPSEAPRTFVLLSDSVTAIQKAIQQSHIPRQALAKNEKFASLLDEFNTSRHSLTFINVPQIVESFYQEISPELVQEGALDESFRQQLPADVVLSRHLSSMAWSNTLVRGGNLAGELIEFVSPTGNLPMLGLLGSMAWPAIAAERWRSISNEVDRKFQRIGLALHLYASDFDSFPARLSDLIPQYISLDDFKAVFQSPFNTGKAVEKPEDADDPERTNLVYLPGRKLKDMSKELLLYEIRPTMAAFTDSGFQTLHHGLRLDNRIRPFTQDQIQRRIRGELEFGAEAVAAAAMERGDNAKVAPKGNVKAKK